MQRRLGIMIGIAAMLVGSVVAMAQLPVEVMAGHKRATVDILFFRFFKNKAAQNGHWLFFNRNRASVDYTMTSSSNLPQFGCTEAISYNPPKWKGLAPVAVVQLLNRGVYPKLGLQYAKSGRAYSLFTWVVAETLKRPQVDWFFLGRYTPKLGNRLYLFTQVELINAFPTGTGNAYTFTQRLRLGLKTKQYQLGAGADFTAIGRNRLTATQNIGVFVRHEF